MEVVNEKTKIGVSAWPLWCPPPPHFGRPKMNLYRISRHLREIRNFDFFSQNGCRPPFWMTDRISGHFTSIRNFYFFSQNGCQQPFWMTEKSLSIAFLAISHQYATFFLSQNDCQQPFWMTENHFWSHFSPF